MHINNEGGNSEKKINKDNKTQNSERKTKKKKKITENHKMPLFTKDYCYLKSMLQNNQYVNAPPANTGKASIWRQSFSPRSIRMNF